MAVWKLAPALAAGNCVVLKPAEQTPLSILALRRADRRPAAGGRRSTSSTASASKPASRCASSKRIAKIAFTGETTTGRLIMQYASENLIPVTLELGGKSPNIFFADVMDDDDDFFDKALEGFAMFALNQGEVCTCPSRALVQESIYDRFMERAVERVKKIKQGHPLDTSTHDRRPGLDRPAGEDPVLHRHRQAGRRPVLDRRQRAPPRGRTRGRLLRRADRLRRPQQDAHLPGRNLWTRRLGDQVQGRGRSARNRQRHALRPRRRRVDPRRQPRLSLRPRHPGRTRLDQLLPRLSRPRGVRRLQAVRHRPRDPQDDARPLPADQEPAGQLQPEGARASSENERPLRDDLARSENKNGRLGELAAAKNVLACAARSA